MKNSFEKLEKECQREVMPCGYTDKLSEKELQKDGWEEIWSFHSKIPDQWDDACRRARSQRMMNYEVTLFYDKKNNVDDERRVIIDSVTIIYRRDKNLIDKDANK